MTRDEGPDPATIIEWMAFATASQKSFPFYRSQREAKHAAFTLHQASEQLYNCVLLVCTFYSPHVHNLAVLLSRPSELTIGWCMCGQQPPAANARCSRS